MESPSSQSESSKEAKKRSQKNEASVLSLISAKPDIDTKEGKVKFGEKELQLLLPIYEQCPYPSKTVYDALAPKIGYPVNKIRNWFMNKRSAEKRKNSQTPSPPKKKRKDTSSEKKEVSKKQKESNLKTPPRKRRKPNTNDEPTQKKAEETYVPPPKRKKPKLSDYFAPPRKKKKRAIEEEYMPPKKKKKRPSKKSGVQQELEDLEDHNTGRWATGSERRRNENAFGYMFGMANPDDMYWCFMNSSLQPFFHTPEFAEYFLTGRHLEAIKGKPGNEKMLSRVLGDLLNEVHRNKSRRVSKASTEKLVKTIVDKIWWIEHREGYEQQLGLHQEDSNQFIGSIMQVLDEELKRDKDDKENNLIGDLYEGVVTSQIRCMECKKTREKEETFLHVDLPIEKATTMEFKYIIIDHDIRVATESRIDDVPRSTKNLAELIRKTSCKPGCPALVLGKLDAVGLITDVEDKSPHAVANTENIAFFVADTSTYPSGEVTCEISFTFIKANGDKDFSLHTRIWALPKKVKKKKLHQIIKKRLKSLIPKGMGNTIPFKLWLYDRKTMVSVPMKDGENIDWPEKPYIKIDNNREMSKIYLKKKKGMMKRIAKKRSKIRLKNLFENYSKVEETDQPLTCDHCKKKTESTKQLKFKKLPKYFIVALKRFRSISATNTIKDNTYVDVPVIFDTETILEDEKFTYDLYATIQHEGAVDSGHYWNNLRRTESSRWRRIDDDHLAEQSEDRAADKSTYICWYKRRPTRASSNV